MKDEATIADIAEAVNCIMQSNGLGPEKVFERPFGS